MKSKLLTALVGLIFGLCSFVGVASAEQVISHYGAYNAEQKSEGHAARSLKSPVTELWQRPKQASEPFRIAILVPQLVDTWLAFSYGAITEAKRLGMESILYSEKSYLNFGDQQRRLMGLSDGQVDGVILSSISYHKMDDTVANVTNVGIPVVAMANDILAQNIMGKSLVSFFDMGYQIGQYVLGDTHNTDGEIRIAFFPGPKGAGWSGDSLLGFEKAIEESGRKKQFKLVNQNFMWGDTRAVMQQRLVKTVLEDHKDIRYIIGNAVAAGIAADLIEGNRVLHPRLKVLSTYINPHVYDSIRAKKISAAACDFPVRQGMYASGMLLRLIEQQKGNKDNIPFRVGPIIEMITQDNIADYSFESIFGARDFKAVDFQRN